MKAVILAAGEGKRLYPVTQHMPKCLLELGGRTLLARYLDALRSLGIKQVVIVVGYKQEMIRLAVKSYQGAVDIRFVANENFQRGSIGSLWAARHELDRRRQPHWPRTCHDVGPGQGWRPGGHVGHQAGMA